MSSVESSLPRFGVSEVFCQGKAFPHIGRPPTICWVDVRATGAKTMTSNFDAQIRFFRYVLRADVREWHMQFVERQAPPAFRLSEEPGVHEGDAGSGRRMSLHRWLAGDAHGGQIELLQQGFQFGSLRAAR